MTVLAGDDPVGRQIDALGLCHGPDLGFRPHEHRRDQSAPGRFQRTEQRFAVAGVNDGTGDGGHPPAAQQELRERIVASQQDLRRREVGVGDPHGRSDDGHGAGDEILVALAHATVEVDLVAVRALRLRGDGAFELVTGGEHALEAELLREDRRSRSGQPPLQESGDDRFRRDRFGDHAFVARAAGLDVKRIDVARDERQRLDVGPRQPMRHRDRGPDRDFVVRVIGIRIRGHSMIRAFLCVPGPRATQPAMVRCNIRKVKLTPRRLRRVARSQMAAGRRCAGEAP